ncbi:MAG: purine-binding chemotaxis protein CheW [Kiritimatiellia bacterium]|jgi:purine-binding chemotaxis protein CheW
MPTQSALDTLEEGHAPTQQFLSFRLAEETYAIEIAAVTEIIGLQSFTAVPDVPPFIRGVINLRGRVIPIMDVRARFQLEPHDYDKRACIIVIHHRGEQVGLVVDRVKDVVDIPTEQLDAHRSIGDAAGDYVQAMAKVDDVVLIVLEFEKLLSYS